MTKYGILMLVNDYPCEDIVYIDNYPQLYPTLEKAQKEMAKLIKSDVDKLNAELKQNDDTSIYYKVKQGCKIVMYNDQDVNLALTKEYVIKQFEDDRG